MTNNEHDLEQDVCNKVLSKWLKLVVIISNYNKLKMI